MMLNPFADNPGFDVTELSLAINEFPQVYGDIQRLGVFPFRGVTGRTVVIERRKDVLTILPNQTFGGPSLTGVSGKNDLREFGCFHYPLEDVVTPEEIQGKRAFGSDSELEFLEIIMARKLQTNARKHRITLEHLMATCLAGKVLDADGTTLVDYFARWGVNEVTVDFALDTEGTNVRTKCTEVLRAVDDGVLGEVYDHVHALCSATFMDQLWAHKSVQEERKFTQPPGGDMRRGFTYAGITFQEYRARAPQPDGTTRLFIPEGTARFFPMGAQDVFAHHAAPADFNETVNTIGLELYARQEPRKFGRGTDIHTQSNPFVICLRPLALVKGTA